MTRVLATAALGVTLGLCLVGCSSDEDDGGARDPNSNLDIDGDGSGSSTPGVGFDPANPNAGVEPLPAESDGLLAMEADLQSQLQAESCEGWAAEPELLPSALVFVVDVSGTMNSGANGTGGSSKYEVTRDALERAIEQLPASLQVGLVFYPNRDNGGAIEQPADLSPCLNLDDNVAVAQLGEAGSEQRANLLRSLGAVNPGPNGATPTHDAFNLAVDMLEQTPAGLDKYVAILTDGEPTLAEGCFGRASPRNPEPTQPIVDGIAAANAQGIKTFMVGSPGSEASVGGGLDVRGWLSDAAIAGGTPGAPGCSRSGPDFCHMDLTQASDFGSALASGLETIAGAVAVSCSYQVPAPPSADLSIDPNKVNLIYDDGQGALFAIARNGAADCTAGWHYAIDDADEIEICGTTCDSLMATPTARLEVLFGCNSVTTPGAIN